MGKLSFKVFTYFAAQSPTNKNQLVLSKNQSQNSLSRHIVEYDPNGGKDNSRRLTGKHETSSMDEFSSGVANRGSSIRIPREVAQKGYGYLEDRRPSSNCDPYTITGLMVKTTLLDESSWTPTKNKE